MELGKVRVNTSERYRKLLRLRSSATLTFVAKLA